jgi:hypothetical protein
MLGGVKDAKRFWPIILKSREKARKELLSQNVLKIEPFQLLYLVITYPYT